MPVFVIAEAGVNHNGDIDRAKRLVDVATAAGANAVKFQTFRADRLVTADAPKAGYQKETSDPQQSQHEMLRLLELDADTHHALAAQCRESGISFLSTPFDIESLHFLVREIGVDCIKLGSGEVTNGPLLLAAARTGRRIILSTGMADLEEVKEALTVLAFGLVGTGLEGTQAFEAAFASPEGQSALASRVTLLHCTTEYPAPFSDINLKAIGTLQRTFSVPVGLSDHSAGIAVPIAAAACNACVIEKHFTLDRTLPGPDHRASLEPSELAEMIAGIRAVEAALGTGEKRPMPSEMANRRIVRRGLFAARPIAAGQTITAADVAIKRPQVGAPAMRFWDLVGRPAPRSYKTGEPLLT